MIPYRTSLIIYTKTRATNIRGQGDAVGNVHCVPLVFTSVI